MVKIRIFDKWIPDMDKHDSGKGKKIWLTNPNNNKDGWFKYVKKTFEKNNKLESIETFENVSEKVAELIATKIKLPCAKIEIGTYYEEKGCLSYNILSKNKTMAEGISYISRRYKYYDVKEGKDLESGKYYCLEIILNSLDKIELKGHFYKIMIFDFIIGNSDRHSNNWAIIKKGKEKERLAPIYDNGSSLCALVKESQIKDYLSSRDKLKFNALVDTSSRSLIRIDGKSRRKPTHKEIIQYLHDNFYDETKDFVKLIIQKLDEKAIEDILNSVKEYISDNRYQLIKKYLQQKIIILKSIYGEG